MRRNGPFLLFVAIVATAIIIAVYAAVLMIFPKEGKSYSDPDVASSVAEGDVLDRNGKILSSQNAAYAIHVDIKDSNSADLAARTAAAWTSSFPSEILGRIDAASDRSDVVILEGIGSLEIAKVRNAFDASGLEYWTVKSHVREYTSEHALWLVRKCEEAASGTISPRPGYGESITYGTDVRMSLDINLQYMVDIRMEDSSDTDVLAVVDSSTNELLAIWSRNGECPIPTGCIIAKDSAIQERNEAIITMEDGFVSVESKNVPSVRILMKGYSESSLQRAELALRDLSISS